MLSATQAGETVGLLGLSYKPGTPVIERSFGVDLAGWLAAEGRRVIGWDPLAITEVRKVLGRLIDLCAERGTMPFAIERGHCDQSDEGFCRH